MKSVFTLSASLAISLLLCCTAQANNHKILGVIAMPRNETNDLALKLPVCRIVKRMLNGGKPVGCAATRPGMDHRLDDPRCP